MDKVIKLEVKLFVVTTEINAELDLKAIKYQIVSEFGGLTEISDFEGYFIENDKMVVDKGKLWLIYANGSDCADIIRDFALKIKTITRQNTQLYAIDNKHYFV